jgi:hypothetical protein
VSARSTGPGWPDSEETMNKLTRILFDQRFDYRIIEFDDRPVVVQNFICWLVLPFHCGEKPMKLVMAGEIRKILKLTSRSRNPHHHSLISWIIPNFPPYMESGLNNWWGVNYRIWNYKVLSYGRNSEKVHYLETETHWCLRYRYIRSQRCCMYKPTLTELQNPGTSHAPSMSLSQSDVKSDVLCTSPHPQQTLIMQCSADQKTLSRSSGASGVQ